MNINYFFQDQFSSAVIMISPEEQLPSQVLQKDIYDKSML